MDPQPTHHFWLLLVALAAVLIGYPYFENSRAGAFLGGVTSLLTLTTIGLGDVTPTTVQTQSLTSIEGVIGVLYLAVLIARIVGVYAQRTSK